MNYVLLCGFSWIKKKVKIEFCVSSRIKTSQAELLVWWCSYTYPRQHGDDFNRNSLKIWLIAFIYFFIVCIRSNRDGKGKKNVEKKYSANVDFLLRTLLNTANEIERKRVSVPKMGMRNYKVACGCMMMITEWEQKIVKNKRSKKPLN